MNLNVRDFRDDPLKRQSRCYLEINVDFRALFLRARFKSGVGAQGVS